MVALSSVLLSRKIVERFPLSTASSLLLQAIDGVICPWLCALQVVVSQALHHFRSSETQPSPVMVALLCVVVVVESNWLCFTIGALSRLLVLMPEQIDWREKQPSQARVAVSEDLKW